MNQQSFPGPFRLPSDQVPAHFEAFYRAQLRHCPGQKLRSFIIAERYCAWAEEVGAPAMSVKAVSRAMLRVGHRRFRSNQTFFRDVQLASDAPDLADNFPGRDVTAPRMATLLTSIDQLDRQISRLNRTLNIELDRLRHAVCAGA